MTEQTLNMIPTWAHIVTENKQEKIEIIFHKTTWREERSFKKITLSQKKQLSLYIYELKMLMTIKSLKERHEFLKATFKAFHLTAETYKEFKYRKVSEAEVQIDAIKNILR